MLRTGVFSWGRGWGGVGGGWGGGFGGLRRGGGRVLGMVVGVSVDMVRFELGKRGKDVRLVGRVKCPRWKRLSERRGMRMQVHANEQCMCCQRSRVSQHALQVHKQLEISDSPS